MNRRDFMRRLLGGAVGVLAGAVALGRKAPAKSKRPDAMAAFARHLADHHEYLRKRQPCLMAGTPVLEAGGIGAPTSVEPDGTLVWEWGEVR